METSSWLAYVLRNRRTGSCLFLAAADRRESESAIGSAVTVLTSSAPEGATHNPLVFSRAKVSLCSSCSMLV